jgi:hypothetical protein
MANKWLAHVKKTMKTMKSKGSYKKGDGLKKVILEAKKTYKKHHRGGGEGDGSGSDSDNGSSSGTGVVAGGRRRRHTKKTHRRRHH